MVICFGVAQCVINRFCRLREHFGEVAKMYQLWNRVLNY